MEALVHNMNYISRWCTVFQQKVQYDDIYITEQKNPFDNKPEAIRALVTKYLLEFCLPSSDYENKKKEEKNGCGISW